MILMAYSVFIQTLYVGMVSALHSSPSVTLSHGGIVEGLTKSVQIGDESVNLNVFLGIPYADPPLGQQRFRPPVKKTFEGTVNTKILPPTCWQYYYSDETFEMKNPAARMWLNNTEMSEDCLYLNVWTPSSANVNSKLPVMVWIYGGGYVSGTSTLDVYDASILAAKYNVVVMSMQYRVGAFGFLRLPSGDQSSSANGNMGLLDQLMALEWMHENINLFGGDPDTVTVFGESSGAVSSSLLWLSPRANKYFKRLIIQSASALGRWAVDTKQDAEKRGGDFALACDCTDPVTSREASLKCLEEKTPENLVDALYTITIKDHVREPILENLLQDRMEKLQQWTEKTYLYFDVPLKAVIDEDLIQKHPRDILSDPYPGLHSAPEILLGANKNEGMYFLLYGLILNKEDYLQSNGKIVLPQAIEKAAQRMTLKEGGEIADFKLISAAQILSKEQLVQGVYEMPASFYGLPDASNHTTISAAELMRLLDAMTGELDFTCPVSDFAHRVSQMPNSKVFLYEFQHKTKNSGLPDWLGVMHGYEIEYVFGMPFSSTFQSKFYNFDDDEKNLSDQMMKWWTNFAKHGDPNDPSESIKTWPTYGSPDNNFLQVDLQSQTASDFHQKGCEFWLKTMRQHLENSN